MRHQINTIETHTSSTRDYSQYVTITREWRDVVGRRAGRVRTYYRVTDASWSRLDRAMRGRAALARMGAVRTTTTVSYS